MAHHRDALNKGAPRDLRPECMVCYRFKPQYTKGVFSLCSKYSYPTWAQENAEGICTLFLNRMETRTGCKI